MYSYRDLAPLDALYSFYRSIGEPIEVRNFISLAIKKSGEQPTDYDKYNPNEPKTYTKAVYNGSNMVIPGQQHQYSPGT